MIGFLCEWKFALQITDIRISILKYDELYFWQGSISFHFIITFQSVTWYLPILQLWNVWII